MTKVKRIGVLSLGKIMGVIYGGLGFLIGSIITLLSFLGFFLSQAIDLPFLPIFGIGAIFLFPLFYGFLGFFAGIFIAAVYNLVAGVVGGIELELERE